MRIACAGLSVLLLSMPACGYELVTHARATSAAYSRSVLNTDPFVLRDWGVELSPSTLSTSYFDGATVRVDSEFETPKMRGVARFSIEGWLIRGAIREDDLTKFGCSVSGGATLAHGRPLEECNPHDDAANIDRVTNHFYDPVYRRGLTAPGLNGISALDWARGSNGQGPTNNFSLAKARNAMYYALTGLGPVVSPPAGSGLPTLEPDLPAGRAAWWATTFRSLGDAMHLVQDMAQPQHTRNDLHPGSAYEAYIDARARQLDFHYIDGVRVEPMPLPPFEMVGIPLMESRSRYKDFWSSVIDSGNVVNGTGLADYSNRSFFTAGTLPNVIPFDLKTYPLPSRNTNSYTREAVPVGVGTTTSYLLSPATDAIINEDVTGPRPARVLSESAFTEDVFPKYSLTRANYDDQAALLLPRAVSYSTGLLNYFFRGRLGFRADPQAPGAYLVRNLSGETMTGCLELYYDTPQERRKPVLDGVNPRCWQTGSLAANAELPFQFDFPPPTDAAVQHEYMLVFRGTMGDETNAVAAKQIRAPRGALYIAGNDSQGHLITMKVDEKGLRVLNGTVNSVLYQTSHIPPTAGGDFDPLKLTLASQLPLPPKLRRIRQASYPAGMFPGYEIETMNLFRDSTKSWVYQRDRITGRFKLLEATRDTSWRSTAPSASLEFSLLRLSASDWTVTWSGTSKEGKPVGGTMQLPPPPGGGSVAYYGVALRAGNGTVVSSDGLTWYGFLGQANNTRTEYELRISPSIPPTASLVAVGSTVISESTSQFIEGGAEGTQRDVSPPATIDYINGEVRTVRSENIGYVKDTRIVRESGAEVESGGCPYDLVQTNKKTDEAEHVREIAATVLLADGTALESEVHSTDKNESHEERRTVITYTSSDGSNTRESCTIATTNPPIVTSGQTESHVSGGGGVSPYLTFTGELQGTIVHSFTQSGDLQSSERRFRGAVIPGSAIYVGDAAPTGEVFFAIPDKSFIFYEPIPGSGMPATITIPNEVVTIVAALWM